MNTVKITPSQVECIFALASTPRDYLLGLYELALGTIEQVQSIDDWPKVNSNTWIHLCSMCQQWDREHKVSAHVSLAGGTWLNQGFSIDNTLSDWEVNPGSVTYKTKETDHDRLYRSTSGSPRLQQS